MITKINNLVTDYVRQGFSSIFWFYNKFTTKGSPMQ